MRLWKYHHQIIQRERGVTDTIQADKSPQTLPETCHASSSPGLEIFNFLAEITSALNPTIISFFTATRLRLTKRDFQPFQITRELRHHVLPYLLSRDLNPLLSLQVGCTASELRVQLFLTRVRTLTSSPWVCGFFGSRSSLSVLPLPFKSSRPHSALDLQASSLQVSIIRPVPPPPRKIPQKLHFGHQTDALGSGRKLFPVPDRSVRYWALKCACA